MEDFNPEKLASQIVSPIKEIETQIKSKSPSNSLSSGFVVPSIDYGLLG